MSSSPSACALAPAGNIMAFLVYCRSKTGTHVRLTVRIVSNVFRGWTLRAKIGLCSVMGISVAEHGSRIARSVGCKDGELGQIWAGWVRLELLAEVPWVKLGGGRK